jgi:hypothetical protein
MTSEQLKKGNALEETVDRMKIIEDYLRSGKLDVIKFQKIADKSSVRGDTLVITTDMDSDFVVEKMIEAGIYAAMTVRAAAENELEKL